MKKLLIYIIFTISILHANINYKDMSMEEKFDLVMLLSPDIESRDELLTISQHLNKEFTNKSLTKKEQLILLNNVNLVHALYDIYVADNYHDITQDELDKAYGSASSIYMERDNKSLNEIIDIAIFEAKHGVAITQMILFLYLTDEWVSNLMKITDETMNKIVQYTTDCANIGNLRCSYELGQAYYNGSHIEQDKPKGLELMLKGVNLFPEAAFNVSVHYFNEGDIDKFIYYSKISSELGSSKSSHNLGIWYLDYIDNRNKEDEKKAFNYFILASSQDEDNIENYYDIARCYTFGFGVKKDLNKAKQYAFKVKGDKVRDDLKLRNSALLGDIYYYIGKDNLKSGIYKDAYESFLKSRDLKNSYSIYELSKMHINAQYVKKDNAKIMKFYKEALDLEHPDATFWYGLNITLGRYGTKKNQSEGLKFMKKSIDLESGYGYYFFGGVYYEGDETYRVDKDIYKSKEYLEKALKLFDKDSTIHKDILKRLNVWFE